MFIENAVQSYNLKLKKLYDLLSEMSVARKLILSFLMAVSIGALAQMKVFLPWTPVPVVMTQIGIIVYASLMGKKWGIVPIAMYVTAGVAGIPWFSSFGSGLSYLTGPTGGYLIGFILSAWFIANLSNHEKVRGNVFAIISVVLFSQLVLVYLPGLLQLSFWLKATGNETAGLNTLLMLGFYPFILGDIVKSIIGGLAVFSLRRR